MAATNSKDLVLSYERADGKTHNMTIPDYRNDITDAEIEMQIGRAVQQECRDRSRMPSSA